MNTRDISYTIGALASCLFSVSPACAAAAIRIWPIDPIIEPDRNASALWLENSGETPAVMQVRVFGWSQKDNEDVYDPQSVVVASPPVVQIAPKSRQLIRLTNTLPQRLSGEAAYRIVIDEIPVRSGASTQGAKPAVEETPGIRFQMRYSIPLFVYGTDVKMAKPPALKFATPPVSCSIEQSGGRKIVRIVNQGAIHARFTDVRFEQGSTTIPVAPGLLGYALVGNSIWRALPDGVAGGEPLTMKINDNPVRTRVSSCTGR